MQFLSRFFGKKHSEPSAPIAAPSSSVASKDWRTNELHLQVLNRFLSAREADNGVPGFWEAALGEPAAAVIQRFSKLGLLVPGSLPEVLTICSSGAELKALLKARGLKVSGRKEEQALRLVEADAEGMARLYAGRVVLKCSDEARIVVEEYNAQKAREWAAAVAASRDALLAHDFEAAVTVAREYNVKQLKLEPPNPLAIPERPTTVKEAAAELAQIVNVRPKILKALAEHEWEPLLIVFVLSKLFGRTCDDWWPEEFVGVPQFEPIVALRMVGFHLQHLRDCASWARLGITKAKIRGCGEDSCEACQKLADRLWPLDDLPELPYENCTCELGCRCFAAPDIPY